jgi:hypothetical protein
MFIECIEQPIGESPEEEQDCDQANWIDRFPQCDFGFVPFVVGGTQRPLLPVLLAKHCRHEIVKQR